MDFLKFHPNARIIGPLPKAVIEYREFDLTEGDGKSQVYLAVSVGRIHAGTAQAV